MGQIKCSNRAVPFGSARLWPALILLELTATLIFQTGCHRGSSRVEGPLSLSVFTALGTGIDLPSSATNIMYGQASVGLGGRARLYRFSAPPEDCLHYAQRLANLKDGRDQTPGSNLEISVTKLETRPTPLSTDTLKAYGLDSVNWFSIAAITNGYSGSGPPNGRGLTWVDMGAGKFYYFWTD